MFFFVNLPISFRLSANSSNLAAVLLSAVVNQIFLSLPLQFYFKLAISSNMGTLLTSAPSHPILASFSMERKATIQTTMGCFIRITRALSIDFCVLNAPPFSL